MSAKIAGKHVLSSLSFGSLYSYELAGEEIIGRLLGIAPVFRIHLSAVHYLRLAAPSEAPPTFLLFNWIHFLPHRRALRPVYVLQIRSHHRIFLKLDATAHFKLRQAIGRRAAQNPRLAA